MAAKVCLWKVPLMLLLTVVLLAASATTVFAEGETPPAPDGSETEQPPVVEETPQPTATEEAPVLEPTPTPDRTSGDPAGHRRTDCRSASHRTDRSGCSNAGRRPANGNARACWR